MTRRPVRHRPLNEPDGLHDFTARAVTHDGVTKTVYVDGAGPAVVVIAEMPGITPHVARFARWAHDAGFTVYMPSLFGTAGALATADGGAAVFRAACRSAEFQALSRGQSSPVTDWLRSLARRAHTECGGPGVGAVGMCFTGNFALSMMLEPAMLAPVLCQPSLPLNDSGALESPPSELQAVRARLDAEDLTVFAVRFDAIGSAHDEGSTPMRALSATVSSPVHFPIVRPIPWCRPSTPSTSIHRTASSPST